MIKKYTNNKNVMRIVEAVLAIKTTGCKIRRAGWQNLTTCVAAIHPYNKDIIRFENGSPIEHINEFLADDWEIIPNTSTTIRLMSFSEAMAKVKDGYAVRREDWIHSTIKKDKMFNIARVRWDKDSQSQRITQFIPTFEDIEATDWIVEDK